MPEATATFLQQHEQVGSGATPPLLYLLVRACRAQRLFLGKSLDPVALTWIALAAGPKGEEAPTQEFDMALLGSESDWPPSVGKLRVGGLLMAPTSSIASAPWRQVVVEGADGERWLLASPLARAPRYQESPRERFMALLLGAMQPETLALGPNVVFDGSMKPPNTRVNFSGTGGQIGAGDLLIAYPEDIQRFAPLPGAVALLLGEVTTPLQALHLALPFEEGALTLVVA